MFELGVPNEEAASNGLTGKHIVGGRVPRPRRDLPAGQPGWF